jgi:hypothetical protein
MGNEDLGRKSRTFLRCVKFKMSIKPDCGDGEDTGVQGMKRPGVTRREMLGCHQGGVQCGQGSQGAL